MKKRIYPLLLAAAVLFISAAASADEKTPPKRFVAAIDKDGYQRVEMTGGEYYFDPAVVVVKVNVPVELTIRKTAGITPISVGGSPATWTEMFWWAYLAIRECGKDKLDAAISSGDWTDACFVAAGTKVKELVDKQPFQEGFLAAVWDGAGGSAASTAVEDSAMLLQGQWAPGTMQANTADKKAVTWDLQWFPFPSVDGGAGKPTDGFGGGNGFAGGKDAPPEAIEVLK